MKRRIIILKKDFINVDEALKNAAEEGIKDETPVESEKRMLPRKTTRLQNTKSEAVNTRTTSSFNPSTFTFRYD